MFMKCVSLSSFTHLSPLHIIPRDVTTRSTGVHAAFRRPGSCRIHGFSIQKSSKINGRALPSDNADFHKVGGSVPSKLVVLMVVCWWFCFFKTPRYDDLGPSNFNTKPCSQGVNNWSKEVMTTKHLPFPCGNLGPSRIFTFITLQVLQATNLWVNQWCSCQVVQD